jgi:hypothetical protein
MNINLVGRIRNVVLSHNRPLVPLLEAVVNSIQSVQTLGVADGAIHIRVLRDTSQSELGIDDDFRPIVAFEIEDNGPGFDEANYESFTTSDTNFKTGAKGIGRFMWLKAFEEVHVRSTFISDGRQFERTFDFLLTPQGIENPVVRTMNGRGRATLVRLSKFRPEYQEHCPRGLETIAERVVEHCLIYFLNDACPFITIGDSKATLVLNELYETKVKEKAVQSQFEIKGQEFIVVHLRLYLSDEKRHMAHFCAHDRVVKSLNIGNTIRDLKAKLLDERGESFKYAAYVSGDYLNDSVIPERTAFYIDHERDELFPDTVYFDEIEAATLDEARLFLQPFLMPITESKLADIARFVQTKAPQYRATIKYMPEALEGIEPGLSDDNLDLELHKLKARINVEIKAQAHELASKNTEDISNMSAYLEEYRKLLPKLSEFSTDQLAEYVLHRRSIISLLEKSLQLADNGRYQLEEIVHRIIFPMRTTSDDIDYEQQNLWLIDERLSYHYFLASDKPMKALPSIETGSKKEPDLLLFNKALAYADSTQPFSNVVIIEFKRPMRGEYSEDENPIKQVTDYINNIKASRVRDVGGRPVRVSANTPFYSYIVCDLTPRLVALAENSYDFTLTPDTMGYFRFHKNLNAYIEIISFEKLVGDAKKRNRILFDKLNLPGF